MMRSLVRADLALGIATMLYGGAYGILSLGGTYVSSQTGNARLANGGPPVNDVRVWRPRFVRLRIFVNAEGRVEREANFLGWMFYPLELLDRRYWHRSRFPLLELLEGRSPSVGRPLSPAGQVS